MKITRLVKTFDLFSVRLHGTALYQPSRREIGFKICETVARREDSGGPEPPPVARPKTSGAGLPFVDTPDERDDG
jgi:hypothetical protein